MDDQQRARVIFGRCVLAGGLLKVGTSAGLCVAAHAMYNVECDQAGSTNSAAGLVAGLAVVQVIIPVYLRLAALTNRHRLGCVLIILFDSSARPASSKLGRTLILTLTLTLTFHPHPHPHPHPNPNPGPDPDPEQVPKKDIDALFDSWDPDGSGTREPT